MRKRISSQPQRESPSVNTDWLDLEALARVEVTSEDAAHPIESALLPVGATGWRAESPGEQTVRLLFEAPQRLRRIRLLFREEKEARTQEFVLRWSPTVDGHRVISCASSITSAHRERVRRSRTTESNWKTWLLSRSPSYRT
jgi:hypothetical protein